MAHTGRWHILLAAGVVVASAVVVWQSSAARSAAQGQPPKRPRWEYCELHKSYNSAKKLLSLRLRTATGVIETNSARELCAKLGAEKEPDHQVAVLNVLGRQGWELVSHNERESHGEPRLLLQAWVFKRPK